MSSQYSIIYSRVSTTILYCTTPALISESLTFWVLISTSSLQDKTERSPGAGEDLDISLCDFLWQQQLLAQPKYIKNISQSLKLFAIQKRKPLKIFLICVVWSSLRQLGEDRVSRQSGRIWGGRRNLNTVTVSVCRLATAGDWRLETTPQHSQSVISLSILDQPHPPLVWPGLTSPRSQLTFSFYQVVSLSFSCYSVSFTFIAWNSWSNSYTAS